MRLLNDLGAFETPSVQAVRQKHITLNIAPQAATAAAATLLCHRWSGRPHTLTCDQAAICSRGLHPIIHVIAWLTTYLLTQEGWKVELAWLVDP